MTVARIVELAVAVALLGGGVWFYTRRTDDRYGSQGAVLLLFVGAIVAIHALGLLEYRPSPSELDLARGGAQ